MTGDDATKTLRTLRNMGVSGEYYEMKDRNFLKKQKMFLSSLPNAMTLTMQDWSRIPEVWAFLNPKRTRSQERYEKELENIELNKKVWCDSWVSLYDIFRSNANGNNFLSGVIWLTIANNPEIYVIPFLNNNEMMQFSYFSSRKLSDIKVLSNIFIAKSQLYRICNVEKDKSIVEPSKDIQRRALMMKGFYSVGEISFNLKIPVDTVMSILSRDK